MGFELCDLLEPECQATVYRHSECARDFEGHGMPPVQTITRDDYRRQLTQSQGKKPNAKETRQDRMVTTAFQLLGLLDSRLSSHNKTDIELQVTSTLAYYSLSEKSVTLIDHQTHHSAAQHRRDQLVLAHEFTHAQQDEVRDLQVFYSREFDGSTDGYYAWRSLLEAEANLSEDLVPTLDDDTELSRSGLRSKLSRINARQHLFAERSKYPYTVSLRNFPYSIAYAFVAERYLEDGLSGISELFDEPRTTMLDFMRDPQDDAVKRISVSWEEPSGSLEQDDDAQRMLDRMGAWVLYTALMRQGLDSKTALRYALAWRGDALALHANRKGENVALLWRVVLSPLKSSDRNALAQHISEQELSTQGAHAAFVHDDELVWVLTQDPDQLDAWVQQAKAQLEDKLYLFAPAKLSPLPRRLVDPGHKANPFGCRGGARRIE